MSSPSNIPSVIILALQGQWRSWWEESVQNTEIPYRPSKDGESVLWRPRRLAGRHSPSATPRYLSMDQPWRFDHNLSSESEKRATHAMQSITSLLIHWFMNLARCSDRQTSVHLKDTKCMWARLSVQEDRLSPPTAVVLKLWFTGNWWSAWVTLSKGEREKKNLKSSESI